MNITYYFTIPPTATNSRPTSNHSGTLPNGRLPSADDNHRQLERTQNITSISSSSLTSSQPDSGISQSRHEAQLARRRQEEEKARTKQMQKSALRNFVQVYVGFVSAKCKGLVPCLIYKALILQTPFTNLEVLISDVRANIPLFTLRTKAVCGII